MRRQYKNKISLSTIVRQMITSVDNSVRVLWCVCVCEGGAGKGGARRERGEVDEKGKGGEEVELDRG